MRIRVVPIEVSIAKLNGNREIPAWGKESAFYSVTKTEDEVSVVCESVYVPSGVKNSRHWSLLKIDETLSFAATGVLASVLGPLKTSRISVFTISTYNTDYILVKKDRLKQVIDALSGSFKIVK